MRSVGCVQIWQFSGRLVMDFRVVREPKTMTEITGGLVIFEWSF